MTTWQITWRLIVILLVLASPVISELAAYFILDAFWPDARIAAFLVGLFNLWLVATSFGWTWSNSSTVG